MRTKVLAMTVCRKSPLFDIVHRRLWKWVQRKKGISIQKMTWVAMYASMWQGWKRLVRPLPPVAKSGQLSNMWLLHEESNRYRIMAWVATYSRYSRWNNMKLLYILLFWPVNKLLYAGEWGWSQGGIDGLYDRVWLLSMERKFVLKLSLDNVRFPLITWSV